MCLICGGHSRTDQYDSNELGDYSTSVWTVWQMTASHYLIQYVSLGLLILYWGVGTGTKAF